MENQQLSELPPAGGPGQLQQQQQQQPPNIPQLPPQDLDKDDYIPEPFRKASPEEVHALTKEQLSSRKKVEKVRIKKLGALGFEVEHAGEVLF